MVINNEIEKTDNLFNKVIQLVELARLQVITAVNMAMVHTYFEIGKMIIEEEQEGKDRAKYGKYVLKQLSKRLTDQLGKGFSEQNLRNMRQFFIKFADRDISIRQKASGELGKVDSTFFTSFNLSWSHYLVLMRIENINERNFYEIEAHKSNWSEPQLKRQYHSSLYERLALSRDKDQVLKLAEQGQIIEKSTDILKNPLVLEFLSLEESNGYSESTLEKAIISKLQHFLLEFGKGFLFEARQKRFTFDEEHFFVDLVFYNRLLQCYVLIDLKTDKLVHQDIGQMQMYVNYYDRYVKLDHEKPTIGILLCKKKKDALVELTLPKDANIYASEYSLYLPDKKLLKQKLNEWTSEFENSLQRLEEE